MRRLCVQTGNKHFRQHNFAAAATAYAAALRSCSPLNTRLAAVLHANRAAALLGQSRCATQQLQRGGGGCSRKPLATPAPHTHTHTLPSPPHVHISTQLRGGAARL